MVPKIVRYYEVSLARKTKYILYVVKAEKIHFAQQIFILHRKDLFLAESPSF